MLYSDEESFFFFFFQKIKKFNFPIGELRTANDPSHFDSAKKKKKITIPLIIRMLILLLKLQKYVGFSYILRCYTVPIYIESRNLNTNYLKL